MPKSHEVATKFATVAEAADRFVSGPSVQSGGSIQADGMSGSLIQREATVLLRVCIAIDVNLFAFSCCCSPVPSQYQSICAHTIFFKSIAR